MVRNSPVGVKPPLLQVVTCNSCKTPNVRQRHSRLRMEVRSRPWRGVKKKSHVVKATPGFHMNRMAASDKPGAAPVVSLEDLEIRSAESNDELYASAWLRSRSFYRYPEDRKFAGVLHQTMKAQAEFELLKSRQLNMVLGRSKDLAKCVIAVAPLQLLSTQPDFDSDMVKDQILAENSQDHVVVGTLDVVAARAVDGEVLIGNSARPAYLANVCVIDAVRRCGVGRLLVQSARDFARELDSDALFVHILSANEAGRRFYKNCGFLVDKVESANEANLRGHCLDGVPGGAKTMLLKDSQLW